MIGHALEAARKLAVRCGSCGMDAWPHRVVGVVADPRVQPYALVEFRCQTPDCDNPIPLEVDLF